MFVLGTTESTKSSKSLSKYQRSSVVLQLYKIIQEWYKKANSRNYRVIKIILESCKDKHSFNIAVKMLYPGITTESNKSFETPLLS